MLTSIQQESFELDSGIMAHYSIEPKLSMSSFGKLLVTTEPSYSWDLCCSCVVLDQFGYELQEGSSYKIKASRTQDAQGNLVWTFNLLLAKKVEPQHQPATAERIIVAGTGTISRVKERCKFDGSGVVQVELALRHQIDVSSTPHSLSICSN
jgi:hypothetical protein